MEYAVLKTEKWPNGQVKRFTSAEIRELTDTQAENLSEVATIVSMTPSFRGYTAVYEDRVIRQALVDLDAIRELVFRFRSRDGRNGLIS